MTDHHKPIVARCHKCKRTTTWVAGRGGRFSRCTECDDRYPCAHECKHLDCADERATKREARQ